MGVVSCVRGGEQRGVCGALRSIGPLSVLHALGTDRRGSVARRSVEFGRLLVGAAHAGWRQPRVSSTRGGHAPVAPVDSASWLAVHRGRGCLCDSRRDLARACSRPSFSVPSPRVPLALAQLTVSAIDWTLAAAVLYVLLPPSPAAFVNVLAAFLLAQLLGLASHIPGGIGVFEGLIVFGLSPFLAASQLVPALVVYRAIYYAVPLTVALMGLVVDEVLLRRAHAARFAASIGRITERMTPQMLATFTFVAGVVLLFSGATPADADRLHWLDRLLPLGVIEASHVTGSVAYGRTACGLRRLAAHALGGREGLLAWLLRTGLRRPLPGRHRRVRPAHRGVRHTLARVDGARGVNGSHAPSSRRAEERDGSALHAPDDLEQGRRLSLVRDGDGADVGIRVDADCAAVGSCRAPVVRTRHTALQTFRVCVRSRTNSTRCGSRGISCIQAGSRCCASPPTCPRWSRAAIGASSRSETHNPSSNARNSVVSRATLSSTSARVVSA